MDTHQIAEKYGLNLQENTSIEDICAEHGCKDMYELCQKIGDGVKWNDPNLKKVIRFRLLSDPSFPMWDVSYCYGEMKDGTLVRVILPFHQLPKFGWKKFVVEAAKKDGIFAKGLGILDNASLLE